MITIEYPTITKQNVFDDPFPHILVEKGIGTDTSIELNHHFVNNAEWVQEQDVAGDIKWAQQVNLDLFDMFYDPSWLQQVFDMLNIPMPNKHYTMKSMAMHGLGAKLIPHTDGPGMSAFKNAQQQFGVDINGCVVQNIYLVDTAKYPETGMQLHDKDKNVIKQIRCLPGTFFAYQNTEHSYHSVPEQQVEFNRILINLKTYW